MSKKSKAFEIVSGKAVQALFKSRRLPGQVEHNVMLESKATDSRNKPIKRQIDVLAHFEDGEHKKALVIEAKDWKRAVPMPMVDQLVGKIATLKDDCQGMIITSHRFTKNAVRLAKHSGLLLYILRKTQPQDFVDKTIPEIKAKVIGRAFKIRNEKIRMAPDVPEQLKVKVASILKKRDSEIQICNSEGECLATLEDIHLKIRDDLEKLGQIETDFLLPFAPNTFIKVENGQLAGITEIFGHFTSMEMGEYDLQNRFDYILVSETEHELLFLDMNMEVKQIGDELAATTEIIDLKKFFPDSFPDEPEESEISENS